MKDYIVIYDYIKFKMTDDCTIIFKQCILIYYGATYHTEAFIRIRSHFFLFMCDVKMFECVGNDNGFVLYYDMVIDANARCFDVIYCLVQLLIGIGILLLRFTNIPIHIASMSHEWQQYVVVVVSCVLDYKCRYYAASSKNRNKNEGIFLLNESVVKNMITCFDD